MSIKPINSSTTLVEQKQEFLKKQKNNSSQQSFTGTFNPVIFLMDGIEKGGFAASFIAQDGIGMVAPRIYEGLNRNRKEDDDGKKIGPLNWEFARREGIREILSGPSAFLIPLGILSIVKKTSGPANNVHVNHIELLGQNLADYISANPKQLENLPELKKGFYYQVFKNALANSTESAYSTNDLKRDATTFAQNLIDAENKLKSDKKADRKLGKAIYNQLIEDYMNIRKLHADPSCNELDMELQVKGKKETLKTDIKRLTQSLNDYTTDVFDKINKFSKKESIQFTENNSEKFIKFIEKFNTKRAGTRVLSNFGMWAAVVGFYTLIPKLYNIGLKHDPGLKGLVEEQATEEDKVANNKPNDKKIAFTGAFSELGKTAMKNDGIISNIMKKFEFNGPSMSVPAMLTLLFGFCLPPRYINAKSDKERKEICVRDILSFSAILFAAKALSRGFSDVFAKLSGLALNVKPKDHNKSFLNKLKNYFTAGEGINVLSSEQIVSKYSNIDKYNGGIEGFFEFLKNNGGNIKKFLNIDKNVRKNTDKILREFTNTTFEKANDGDIIDAFNNAKGTIAYEKICTIFSSPDNKIINRAKTLNSAFSFASIIVLVPAFMMWLARYCENMTKKAIEKEKQAKLNNNASTQNQTNKQSEEKTIALSNKPSMAGFLNK